ncbi:peptidylprolyl isomerase [Gangjinia marincola]|uniref:peptidylprolyl isomerase n=1 Tax=Gangjinia marincola TaxID=578463 RepID=A0ABN1MG04_9FLAO
MKRIYVIFLIALYSGISFAQKNEDKVLLTIEDTPIYGSEFKRVYLKNLDLVQDEEHKDIDQYLDLFTEYKLKVKEAEALKLDDEASFKKEFKKYRSQLAKNYLTDTKVTNELIREAHERLQYKVKASHILIGMNAVASGADTLKAYNKAIEARDKIINGAAFDIVAKEYSTDPSAKKNGGDLGWFSAFKMVYPFESGAYDTPVGEVSMPIRTTFGYHIIKVEDKRKSMGEVSAAHIMVALKKGDSLINAEEKINQIYDRLKQGESFDELARQYSDDRNTAKKGGELSRFSAGRLNSEAFENAAFALENPGDLSQPVKTKYGWHIIKLIEKFPVASFEEMKNELEAKVKKDSRAQVITTSLSQQLKDRYEITDNKEALAYFYENVSDSILVGKWNYKALESIPQKKIISLRDKSKSYQDFAKYIATRQRGIKGVSDKNATIKKWYDGFIRDFVLQYHQENLENVNEDFANLVGEYRDGLLLFDLMEQEVWNKAKDDSLGLNNFYKENKQKYESSKRFEAVIAKGKNKRNIELVKTSLEEEMAVVDIKKSLSPQARKDVIFSKGKYEVDNSIFPADLKEEKGVSAIYTQGDTFTVVHIEDIIPSGIKSFEDAKGEVISDYQQYLEEKFKASLKEKYTVKVNKKNLKKIKKELEKA